MTIITDGRVSPFGHPGITACVQLPLAYRSLPRPSSPPCTQASPAYILSLDQISDSNKHNYCALSTRKHTTRKPTRNLTNESILLVLPLRRTEAAHDEIESVLILGLRGLIRPQNPNPTITTSFRCQTTVPLRARTGVRSRGRKMRSAGFDACRTNTLNIYENRTLRSRMIRDERTR